MQELIDQPDAGDRGQVAWISTDGGTKSLYRRDNPTRPWTKACNSNLEGADFAMFQSLRRKGYVLVHPDGSSVLDEGGHAVGVERMPPTRLKQELTLQDIDATLARLKPNDGIGTDEDIAKGFRQRAALMVFTDSLEGLGVEVLRGYAIQAGLYMQRKRDTTNDDNAVPDSLLPVLGVLEPLVVVSMVDYISKLSKEELVDTLRTSLPQIARLLAVRGEA